MAEIELVPEANMHVVLPTFTRDPFAPILLASPPLVTTEEQDTALRVILALTSSDTRFAQKAYDAIKLILSGGSLTSVPVLNTVEPPSGIVGTSNLKMKCKGTSFDSTCTILMNGVAMPTSFTSATEISTDLNLIGATPEVRTVVVRNGLGVTSQSRTFTVTAS